MSKRSGDNQLSREALLSEVERLRDTVPDRDLEQVIADLRIHQEELQAQQEEIIQSQRELEDMRDRYAELFTFAPLGYLVLNFDGVIREANNTAAALIGVDPRKLIDSPLFLYVLERDRRAALDHISRCRRGEPHVTTDVSLLSRTGAEIAVQLTSAPARRGPREYFLTTITDLRERQRAEAERTRIRDEQRQLLHEQQLVRAASEAKDRFIAMLSHELRTPLTPILLSLDAIQQQGSVSESVAQALSMIHRNVLLEARLIDDLLDVSRIVQGKLSLAPEAIDLHALVREIIEMLDEQMHTSQLSVTVNPAAGAYWVRADPLRLRQVLWNLMHNAIRNTPPGGMVTVSTANRRDGWVVLTVSDTGHGIDTELLPRIFNLFEQDEEVRRRGVGLGLGLPISKGIIEAHGGRIQAASAGRERGAALTIELPTIAAPVHEVAAAAPVAPRPPQGFRILLVEDNEDSAVALAALLQMHTFDVRVAHTIEEAIGMTEGINLVISDIGLPDGSGHDLMRRIQARGHIPGIALSGYGTSEDQRRSAEAGFNYHLVKPVEPQRLLDVLTELMTAPPN
jgi:PAS domain S-box-containing protein